MGRGEGNGVGCGDGKGVGCVVSATGMGGGMMIGSRVGTRVLNVGVGATGATMFRGIGAGVSAAQQNSLKGNRREG